MQEKQPLDTLKMLLKNHNFTENHQDDYNNNADKFLSTLIEAVWWLGLILS